MSREKFQKQLIDDPNMPLEPDEIETLFEDREEKKEIERLLTDKHFNYSLIRGLKPMNSSKSVGALEFSELYEDYMLYVREIVKFQNWYKVEGGEIQVRENSNIEIDSYGYAVVRPEGKKEKDIYLRVDNGMIISVIILPRSNDPLPRQGKPKQNILEQMQLVPMNELNDYTIWLKRMKNAK